MVWSIYGICAAIVLVPLAALVLAWWIGPLLHLPYRPTWKRTSLTIGALMLAGVILLVIWPFWLAPPYFQNTPLVYIGLALLWFPVLIIGILLWPTGITGSSVIVMLVIGYILGVIGSAMAGPHFNAWAFRAEDCQQQLLTDGQTHYTCRHTFSFGVASTTDEYTLEGPQGSPFVRLVSTTHRDNP